MSPPGPRFPAPVFRMFSFRRGAAAVRSRCLEAQSWKAESGKAESGEAQSGEAQSGKAQSGKAQSGKAQSGDAESWDAESWEVQRRRPVLPLAVPRFRLWQPCDGRLCVGFFTCCVINGRVCDPSYRHNWNSRRA